jgi:hypothetical protein
MYNILSPESFYKTALKASGFNPPAPENFEKIAAVKGTTVPVVKLAAYFFEQTQRDGVPFSDEQARGAECLRMAQAYVAHADQQKIAAQEAVNGLANYLEQAAATYCTQHNIPLKGLEAIKVASMQKYAWSENLPESILNDPALAHTFVPANELGERIQRANGAPASLQGYSPTEVGQRFGGGPNLGILDNAGILASRTGNWIKSNPGTAAGIGAGAAGLGLGAYYLLKKRQAEQEAAENALAGA